MPLTHFKMPVRHTIRIPFTLYMTPVKRAFLSLIPFTTRIGYSLLHFSPPHDSRWTYAFSASTFFTHFVRHLFCTLSQTLLAYAFYSLRTAVKHILPLFVFFHGSRQRSTSSTFLRSPLNVRSFIPFTPFLHSHRTYVSSR